MTREASVQGCGHSAVGRCEPPALCSSGCPVLFTSPASSLPSSPCPLSLPSPLSSPLEGECLGHPSMAMLPQCQLQSCKWAWCLWETRDPIPSYPTSVLSNPRLAGHTCALFTSPSVMSDFSGYPPGTGRWLGPPSNPSFPGYPCDETQFLPGFAPCASGLRGAKKILWGGPRQVTLGPLPFWGAVGQGKLSTPQRMWRAGPDTGRLITGLRVSPSGESTQWPFISHLPSPAHHT